MRDMSIEHLETDCWIFTGGSPAGHTDNDDDDDDDDADDYDADNDNDDDDYGADD